MWNVCDILRQIHVPIYIYNLDFTHPYTAVDWFVLDFNKGRFIMISVITNIYNKEPKGPTLM
jgi:hypothetical protein